MRTLLVFFMLVLAALMLPACNPEEPIVDPTAPHIDLITENISTAPGVQFLIEASVSDDIGIKAIHLEKPDWFLDKLIDLSDSTRKEYLLSYKFLTPGDAAFMPHTLLVLVEDHGGNITSAEVTLTMDRDVTPPLIKVTSPESGGLIQGGDELEFFIELTDANGIDTFRLSSPEFLIDTMVVFDPPNPRYIFVKDYRLPKELAEGSYFVNVQTSDSTGNVAKEVISLSVGGINKVYCVGGASFGGWQADNPMPMQADEENPGWFEIVTYSWGIEDYNGVKFIGQKSWGPLNWGLDPSDLSTMVNAENSEKIVLGDAGYYRVRFNPASLEYSVEKEEATTLVMSEMYILGEGITGMFESWGNPSGALSMTQDPDNPYIYLLSAEFSDVGPSDYGANFIFIGDRSNVETFHLGFRNIPEDVFDPEWGYDFPGFVMGNISVDLDPLTDSELGSISNPWDVAPYVAYYMQPGTYTIKMDYHIRHASITIE
jgi:hypothetical protein